MSERARAGAALAMLAVVGALFVFKYAHRVTEAAPWLALGYAAAFVALSAGLRRVRPAPVGRLGGGVLGGALVAAAIAVGTLWPDGGEVARLPAIEVWWERVFDGRFPYGPPVRPSGFPGLFALSLPFYLSGLLRYLPAVGLAVFVAVVWAGLERPGDRFFVLATAALLPTTWYEVLLQSELLLNVSLVIGALMIAERLVGRRLDRGEDVGAGRVLAAGAALGLVLSTRLVVAVPLGMYVAYRFRGRYAEVVPAAVTAAAAFGLTLAPLLFWDVGRFIAEGPFAVQSLYLPVVLAGALGIGALALATGARSDAGLLFRMGAVLFAFAAVSLGLTMGRMGAAEAVLASGFDLTYFVFCVPPLVLSLAPFSFRAGPDLTSRRGRGARGTGRRPLRGPGAPQRGGAGAA